MVVIKKKRRIELWEANPHCHWCGILTDLSSTADGVGFPTQATIDHLFNRLDPERKLNGNADKQVLSCYKCNAKRGKEYQQEQQRQGNLQAWDKEVRPLLETKPLTYQIAEVAPETLKSIK